MKLSIIVPVYKAESYLRQCIDSLVAQTIDEYEIILINDGSPDNSYKIMEEYRERYPGIIKTVSVENGGQGRARNIGINMAQGEYLGFVDSDDWISPDMYNKMCSLMDESGADVVCCDIEEHYADGSVSIQKTPQGNDALLSAGSACNKLFRRSKLGEIRFPEGLWYEDFDFSAKAECIADSVGFVSEPLYMYRVGHSSTMNNDNALKNLDIIRIMDDLKAFLSPRNMNEEFRFLIINHVLLDTINRVNRQKSPDKKKVLAELRAYTRKNVPSLRSCESYRQEGTKRRIIMFLNYYGLTSISKLLLNIKKRLS